MFMSLVGEGLVIFARAFESDKYIVTLFTEEHGLVSGFVKATKAQKATVQLGNIVSFEQFKRLDDQLGKLSLDTLHSFTMYAFEDEMRLLSIGYVCDTLKQVLKEGDPHRNLYHATVKFLYELPERHLWRRVSMWELHLLHSVGYGLHLNDDEAVRGEGDDSPLAYVSPRSGRAVSAHMGAPYKDKMLTLPALFGGKSEDFLDVFALTGHFLSQAIEISRLSARTALISVGKEEGFTS